jgi:hypothetical protein
MRLFFHKLAHWEYWPMAPVYLPVFFQWAYYAIRARTVFFFNAANPSIKNGGFMAESKKQIYDLLPARLYPKTELVREGDSFEKVLAMLKHSDMGFPMIAKPDIGLRGQAVRKISDAAALEAYHKKSAFDYLLQDIIPYANEFGIFYVRYPHEETGRITGMVAKEFMIVEGDGVLTLEQLIDGTPRFALQKKALQREYGQKLCEVLPKGEKRNLMPYGNHARGAKFTDATRLITPALVEMIDRICRRVPGFYYGRLDVMYDTFEKLVRGEDFQIVELNGTASEPTHMYDPAHSLFFAWSELVRHVRYMFEIGAENHKRGVPYLTRKDGVAQYRLHRKQSKKIANF